MREYPAYGRTIAAHIARGQKPMAVAVLLGAIWRYFDHVPKVCIKPDEWALGRYELGFLRGLHVVVIAGDECTGARLAELLVDVMRVGPVLVWVYDLEGKAVYDGEGSALEMKAWLRDLVHAAGGETNLSFGAIDAAVTVMVEAQRRAAELWTREFTRVQQRGDLEASTRFALREHEIKDKVRELFRSPFGDTGDARAA